MVEIVAPAEFSKKERESVEVKNTTLLLFAFVAASNNPTVDGDNAVLLTHPLQVQVFLFPALAGVLLKYAESAELNRKLRSMR
ncbi:MAG: hypothetical protein EBR82_70230 [Caulobacteraceae bacterium]|nr:hypothetical protein [Caulobacteraceae bacterium]